MRVTLKGRRMAYNVFSAMTSSPEFKRAKITASVTRNEIRLDSKLIPATLVAFAMPFFALEGVEKFTTEMSSSFSGKKLSSSSTMYRINFTF